MAFPEQAALMDFFQSINPSATTLTNEIAAAFQSVTYAKGDFFLQGGKRSNEYLFLEKGIMRAYLFDIDGNEVTTNFFSSGSVVLEVASFFLRIPSQENIQAMTACTGWKTSFDELNGLFHSFPAFRETGRAVLVKTLVNLKMRTLSMINKRAEQRYADLLTNNPEIFQQVPLKYIASFLGITDTSLSRIRKEFGTK